MFIVATARQMKIERRKIELYCVGSGLIGRKVSPHMMLLLAACGGAVGKKKK